MNGGTCTINNANMMTCLCTPVFSGLRCEHEECTSFECNSNDPCDRMQCKNDGTCHVIDDKAICNCTIQWNGRFCEVSDDLSLIICKIRNPMINFAICFVCRIMCVKRIIVLAIAKTMVFVSWTMADMPRVNVWANGLDVDVIIRQFVLIAVVTVVRPTRSMNACK